MTTTTTDHGDQPERTGATLTDKERASLIMHLLARRCRDVGDWLFWEDIPELGEHEFERLVNEVDIEARAMGARARQADGLLGVDGLHILEQLQ